MANFLPCDFVSFCGNGERATSRKRQANGVWLPFAVVIAEKVKARRRQHTTNQPHEPHTLSCLQPGIPVLRDLISCENSRFQGTKKNIHKIDDSVGILNMSGIPVSREIASSTFESLTV